MIAVVPVEEMRQCDDCSHVMSVAFSHSEDCGVEDIKMMDDTLQVLLETPRGRTAAVTVPTSYFDDSLLLAEASPSSNKEGYDVLIALLVEAAKRRDVDRYESRHNALSHKLSAEAAKHLVMLHNGRIMEPHQFPSPALIQQVQTQRHNGIVFQLKCRGRGGMDRQNRVGSKFGGGGVSSSQNAERERKDRLKRLALESIDLAKDPYLMRNHLGTYECKLCLTLHTNEANYLAHTQGKKHQQGLAKRAYMEKLKEEKEQQQQLQSGMPLSSTNQQLQPKQKKIRIGRPAYQVFKSRDADTNQRCLSFELQYPEIEDELQPRHRFMSAFEQRVESPPDRRFQYLLFAAEPYDTVAFKIPNEPIDKGQDRFVTHWDSDDKKFTLSLYFIEQQEGEEGGEQQETAEVQGQAGTQ